MPRKKTGPPSGPQPIDPKAWRELSADSRESASLSAPSMLNNAVEAARLDPTAFCRFVLRDEKTGRPIKLSPNHVRWHHVLDQRTKVILWAHIEGGKTQQVSIGRVLYEIGNNPNLRVGIVSKTNDLAMKIVRTLGKYIRESAELRRVFPHLRPSADPAMPWTSHKLTVARTAIAKDPTVQAAGVFGSIHGARLDLLVLDDILDDTNTRSATLRDRLWDWLRSTLFGRLTEGGRLWALANAWHADDAMHRLEKEPGFLGLRFPVLDAAGKSTWPEHWPLKRIEGAREIMGSVEFARALLCEVREEKFGEVAPPEPQLPLAEFIPAVTPAFDAPLHLAPLIEGFERSEREEVRLLFSVPPQHSKTTTVEHGLLRSMLRKPGSRNAYVSFSIGRGAKIGLETRWLAERLGLHVEGSRTDWRLPNGSSCLFTGVDGGLSGNPIDSLLLIDDPHKNAAEATSSVLREHVIDWYRGVLVPRLHPGASIILTSTRWNVDDLYGTLAKLPSWTAVNLPAIDSEGRALWPARRPLEFLEAQRAQMTEYEWAALWMGVPRLRGEAVFSDVHYYTEPPKEGYRVGMGVDMAYTDKTSGDYCAAVAMAAVTRADGRQVFYVLDVRRAHAPPPKFAAELRSLSAAFPGAWMLWFTSTTEQGLADFMREGSPLEARLPLVGEVAKADKFVRAAPLAAAWNDGRVLVPRSATGDSPEWVAPFVAELSAFTGVRDRHDDQVDAAAAAVELLLRGAAVARVRAVPSKFGVGAVGAGERTGAGGKPEAPKPAGDPFTDWA